MGHAAPSELGQAGLSMKQRGVGIFSKEGHQKSDGLSRVTAPLSQKRGS